MFGLAAQSQILELAQALLAGEAETALRELNDLAKHGKDLGRLMADLLGHFRNLLIYQVSQRRSAIAGSVRIRGGSAGGASQRRRTPTR